MTRLIVFCLKGNKYFSKNHAMNRRTSTNGVMRIIHSGKVMSMPLNLFRLSSTIRFGGVPIGVIIPPRFAPTGMASAKAMRPLPSAGNERSTGPRKASIMAAVAVLLTKAENNAVTRMKPRSTVSDFVPKGLSSTLAKTTSSFVFVIPIANTKPPINSMIVGLAKQCMMSAYFTKVPYSSPDKKLNALFDTVSSIITTTIIDVTHEAKASVSHIRAAKTNKAITRCCTTVSPLSPIS